MSGVVIGHRFQSFSAPGSMGTWIDTTFWFCHWPALDAPTRIFDPASSGLAVVGNTPRNVVFPAGTTFPDYHPDALYDAQKAVGRALINLSAAEAATYMKAYDAKAARLPPTATKHRTRSDCHFLRHKELISAPEEKPIYQDYVAELAPKEVADLLDEKTDIKSLQATARYVKVEDSADGPKFRIVADKVEPV